MDEPIMAITGAGGFIGVRMVQRAIEAGYAVRGLDLSPEAAARAERHGAEVIVGDICDAGHVAQLCEGADVVFHTAAVVGEDGAWSLYQRVNVDGTRTVLEGARRCGVRRAVHLSSVMVYGFDFPEDVDEDGPFDGAGNPYCQTKLESDRVALSLHRAGELDVTVIRAGDVYGPGCESWVVRPVQLMKKGLFCLPDGGRGVINHVHVDNLLDAVFAAIDRGVAGAAFNVTDGRATQCREFFGHYARMLHRPLITLPRTLLEPGLRTLDKAFRMLGGSPSFSPSALRFLSRPARYSIARAQRELGYSPRISLEEGMAALEPWLRSQGLV